MPPNVHSPSTIVFYAALRDTAHELGSPMNWAWASSLDHIWRSPTFPMWLTLAAAGIFCIIGLMAPELCSPLACPAFRSLVDSRQLAVNMDDRVYENMITRYASSWNAPVQAGAGLVAALPPTMPTGKPTNAEFPTAASTPAVSIMAPEPVPGASKPAAAAATRAPATAPTPAAATAAA